MNKNVPVRPHRFFFFSPVVLLLVLCALSACGACGKSSQNTDEKDTLNLIPIDSTLANRLDSFVHRPRVNGLFGLSVFDLTAQKPVYAYDDTVPQPSASTMKLISGLAGLHLLGPSYQYTTTLYAQGEVVDGELRGNLALKAGLDPQLQEQDVDTLVMALRERGIKRFTGRLYIDLTLQQPITAEKHWQPWDLSFSRYGLLYRGPDRVARTLKSHLRARGIAVADSQVVMGRMPLKGMTAVSTHKLPIAMVTRRMWKNSSNTQATSLLYTIGHRTAPNRDMAEAGVDYVRKFMATELGLRDTSLVVHDGCGLCVHNRLHPRALIAALRYGYAHQELFNLLYEDLAVAGVDGSMARLMTGPKTRGKVRAKTGTLSHPYGISSLAGYCYGANGHLLCFAIMNSQMSVLDAHVLQTRLCELLLR